MNLFDHVRINIIPIWANSKRPAVKWEQYQHEQYPRDKLKDWHGNFAAVCGKVSSNLAIVDFDDEKLHTRFFKDIKTYTVKTPNGGVHLYFFSKSDVPKTPKFSGYPIDLQGEGSYALCPPSNIEGKRYEVIKDVEILEVDDVFALLNSYLPKHEERAEDLEEFKQRIDFSNIVERYVHPEYHGKGYWQGFCPFHNDRPGGTPSLTIYDDSFYCFGCGAAGDVIKFIELTEKVDFKGAVKKLEELTGIKYFKDRKEPAHKGKDEEKVIELRTIQTLPNGNLAELIYVPKEDKVHFILWDGNSASIVDELKMNPIIYKPPSDTEPFRKGVVHLPSGIEEYGSINELVAELKTFMLKYLDITDVDYEFCAYEILFSYLQDVFNTTPFLRALGDTGCGKSRLLDVVGRLCYRATVISGAVTSAPIYRLAENWKGTLVIDEADFKESDLYNEIIKILNCRYEKGRPVIRCRKEQPDKIEMFDDYGLTVLATRKEFRDVALESRCYTIVMQETDRKGIPKNLPKEFFEEQAKLRNKLLLFRLRNYKKEVELKEENLEGLEPRIIQIMLPLLSIIENKDAKERMLGLIREYQKRLIGERQDTVEGQIVLALDALLREFPEDAEITPKLIAEKMVENGWEITPSTIGRKLKALGFKSLRKPGGDRKRIIVIDKRVWAKCRRRYIGIDEESNIEKSAPTTKSILSNTGWDRWDTRDSNIGDTLEKTAEAQSPNEKEVEIPKVDELGTWMLSHYKSHKGIPKEFFVRDVLKAFPNADPTEIEKFYEVLEKYQQEGVL